MVATGKTVDFPGAFSLPSAGADGADKRQTEERWQVLEDHLNRRPKMRALSDTVSSYIPPTTEVEWAWNAVAYDTSNMWNGATRFIINKNTEGDYHLQLEAAAVPISATDAIQVGIVVFRYSSPYAPTVYNILVGGGFGNAPYLDSLNITVEDSLYAGDEVAVIFSFSNTTDDWIILGSGAEYIGPSMSEPGLLTRFTMRKLL